MQVPFLPRVTGACGSRWSPAERRTDAQLHWLGAVPLLAAAACCQGRCLSCTLSPSSRARARAWAGFAGVEYSQNFKSYQDLIVSLNLCHEHLSPVQTKTRQGPSQAATGTATLFSLRCKNWILPQKPLCGSDRRELKKYLE